MQVVGCLTLYLIFLHGIKIKKNIYIVFSYIYSWYLLNIVILKPSRLFVHSHCPDCFYHFEQGQEEGGAVREVALGVVILFSYGLRFWHYCVYVGVSCPPVIIIALKSLSCSAVIARVYWIVKDNRSLWIAIICWGTNSCANYVFEGHRVRVSFSYYVNFDLFCLMTIPSNCRVWRINAVDAYETFRKKIVDFKNLG